MIRGGALMKLSQNGTVERIRFLLFLFRQDLQDYQELFFACGEGPFGRRPHYPNYPVDPVQLIFLNKNPFLFFFQNL